MTSRQALVKSAQRWETASVIWMVLEAAGALTAAWRSHSVALGGFGADSLIELLSAGVLLWRLHRELVAPDSEDAWRVERQAARVSLFLLTILAAVLVISAAAAFWRHIPESPSPLGLMITAVSSVLMIVFARAKRRLGIALGSQALQADAVEGWVCAYMAWAALGGTAAVMLFHWGWADSLAALLIAYWVAKEVWEIREELEEKNPD